MERQIEGVLRPGEFIHDRAFSGISWWSAISYSYPAANLGRPKEIKSASNSRSLMPELLPFTAIHSHRISNDL
jgi:hypothetical protein